MFYIFNTNKVCIGSCNAEPCSIDLSSRGEHAIEFTQECNLGWILNEENIPQAPVAAPLTLEELTTKMRQQRDSLLLDFDGYLYRNQFFWDTLTAEQQSERISYRQLLLDVPQQAGFPTEIIWPAYPTL